MIAFLGLVSSLIAVVTAQSQCFFPLELQGEYLTQQTYTQGDPHNYTEITILPDGIPVWGVCQWKSENMVVLYDKTSGYDCMRCFYLLLRTPNVVQIYTEGLDRCYMNEESAIQSCPSMENIQANKAREMTLYKNRSFKPDGRIDRVTCPFVGQFRFSYSSFIGRRKGDICRDLASSVETCPRSSQLKFSFRECSFGRRDLNLECFGTWKSFDGNNYIALFDPEANSDDLMPKYRCGMYKEEPLGVINLSMGADSSCRRQLLSPMQGQENFKLTQRGAATLPGGLFSTCSFPDWAQGKWKDLEISRNQFIYSDNVFDKSYSGVCLRDASPIGERYSLYTVDQCGKQSFTCVWLKRRSQNVMELILAPNYDQANISRMCSDVMFWNKEWATHSRVLPSKFSCPVSGEYVGLLPDDNSLCARLTSDCSRPHMMNYKIFPCDNTSVPYEDTSQQASEQYPVSRSYRRYRNKRDAGRDFNIIPGKEIERTYQCLGEWEEGGKMYTYTWRKDVNKYECFSGVKVSSGEAFIIEAGVTCRRGLNPLMDGMRIVKRSSCLEWENQQADEANSIKRTPSRQRNSKSIRWSSFGRAALTSGTEKIDIQFPAILLLAFACICTSSLIQM